LQGENSPANDLDLFRLRNPADPNGGKKKEKPPVGEEIKVNSSTSIFPPVHLPRSKKKEGEKKEKRGRESATMGGEKSTEYAPTSSPSSSLPRPGGQREGEELIREIGKRIDGN